MVQCFIYNSLDVVEFVIVFASVSCNFRQFVFFLFLILVDDVEYLKQTKIGLFILVFVKIVSFI